MNLEPWGKIHVSPPYLFCSFSLVSFNHHCNCSIDQLGASICQQKDHYYTHAFSHSPRRANGFSTMGINSLFVFPEMSGVKRSRDSLFEVRFSSSSPIVGLRTCSVLLCLMDLLACGSILSSVHVEFCAFSHHCQTTYCSVISLVELSM